MANILTSANIVDIRRFCGYLQQPSGVVSAAALASALTSVMQNSVFTVSADQLTAVINNISASNLSLNGDPLQIAIAALTSDMVAVVLTTYLAPLNAMELALANSYSLLNVSKADVFVRNENELSDRRDLLEDWRIRLCRFMGVSAGSQLYVETPAIFTTGDTGQGYSW